MREVCVLKRRPLEVLSKPGRTVAQRQQRYAVDIFLDHSVEIRIE
jgi:hypothetical protein